MMSTEAESDALPAVYALIWKASDCGDAADEAFADRIPRIMAWLRTLKAGGHLVACGGGAFEEPAGGITLIRADSPEHALELDQNPLNEIGQTELFVWDVYHADLQTNLSAFE